MSTESEALAKRIVRLLGAMPGLTEKRMFGGNCFLINGHMCCGVTGDGTLMVRVGPDAYEECLQQAHAREMDFTGRPMRGLVFVDQQGFEDDLDLQQWLDRGLSFASGLPPRNNGPAPRNK